MVVQLAACAKFGEVENCKIQSELRLGAPTSSDSIWNFELRLSGGGALQYGVALLVVPPPLRLEFDCAEPGLDHGRVWLHQCRDSDP